jgi:hypothetical protein
LPVLSRLTEITPLVQVATSELHRTATGVVGGPDGQMAGLHDRNARGLLASLHRAGPA